MKWIRVKNKLPPVDNEVLVILSNEIFINYLKLIKDDNEFYSYYPQFTGDKYAWIDRDGYICKFDEVTQWMPLPEVPDEK
jgi:hypothetical protein